VDEWWRRLRAHGVEFVKEPADNPPYRIYNAFVRDPNGYLVEIQRFWEPLVVTDIYRPHPGAARLRLPLFRQDP
jgi:hypothetical protein